MLREQVFRLLFRVEFHQPEDMDEQLSLFSELPLIPLSEDDEDVLCMRPEESEEVLERYEKVREHLKEIDEQINERTVGWDTDRMGKADLTVVRLAVYELLYDDDVPTGVAINEAVELARKYGQDNSASFVNGVLARFAEGT